MVKVNAMTPAAEVGLQEGDLVQMVNGKAVEQFTLEQLRNMLQQDVTLP